MTVSSTTSKAIYSGNGTTTAFTVPFYFLEAADVQVILRSGTTETVQTLTTNYTVSGAGVTSGGTVTMLVAPAVGTTLTILRNIEATQETDLVPNDRLPAETLETALDKATMLIQQLAEQSGRSLKYPASDAAMSAQLPVSSARAGKYLGFDATGLPVVAAGPATPYSAADVAYTASGSGAVLRSVASKLSDSVSVKDFGAVGNGTTDDTNAFVLAIAAAASTGRVVYVPGTSAYYKLLDELTVPDNVLVFGDGWSSRIRQETAQRNVFIAGNNCSFERLRISGDGVARNAVSLDKENGIYVEGKRNVNVRSCFVDGWQSCGVQFANCNNYSVLHSTFFGNYYSFPTGTGASSDICAYSSSAGARAVIIGNFCFSDNSQGIFYNSQGFDSDATITGNVCVTLNSSWAEVASGSLNRRHGIVTSYGGGPGGKITVTGNVCRNTLVSGIYVAMGASGQVAVVVSGNVCSLNGFATVSDGTLAGGISVNGGQSGLVISNNVIYDFRGTASNFVGGITYNDSNADANASAIIEGNSIDTSTAYGIVMKSTPRNVDVRGNRTRGCVKDDISLIAVTSGASVTGIRITENRCIRLNATSPAIYVDTNVSTNRIWIEGNHLTGFDKAPSALVNSGIYLRRGDVMSATVQSNKIDTFFYGISTEQPMSGRELSRLRINQNELLNLDEGISIRGAAASALVPCFGNRFVSVTNKFAGAGYDIAGIEVSAILNDTRIHFESTASPTARTFAVGDHAKNSAPASGQPKGWFCTVAGTPGTWTSEGNL